MNYEYYEASSLTIQVISFILLTTLTVFLLCCRQPERRLRLEIICQERTQVKPRRENSYTILVEKSVQPRTDFQTQTNKSVWFNTQSVEREEEDTGPPLHYCSLPLLAVSQPLSHFPSAPEFEEEVKEKETDKIVPKEEHETDNRDLCKGLEEERQPLHTVHTVFSSQSQSRQFRDLEITSEVLITRIAQIEKRLKKSNIPA